jgi:SAM-dependent methyltransferase
MTTQRDDHKTGPSLAEQVSRLYDIIAGYHLTNLIEVAREVGAWERIAAQPGIPSAKLAAILGTDPYYTEVLCRTAFAFELLEREGEGWRMAPHMDAILGDPGSTFYLGRAAKVHLALGGEDYPDLADRLRSGQIVPYQDHGDALIGEIADSLRSLPRMFVDLVLPRLPSLSARLAAGARVLDLGCGGGWAIVELAERFPSSLVDGGDIEPRSIQLARERIIRHGLTERCSARLLGVDGLTDEARYDVITMFLVVHEIQPEIKDRVLASANGALTAGGSLVIFDEAYPETDAALRMMPSRFSAVAQWFELTWGNRIDTAAELRDRCERAGFRVADELTFSRFTIVVAEKPN